VVISVSDENESYTESRIRLSSETELQWKWLSSFGRKLNQTESACACHNLTLWHAHRPFDALHLPLSIPIAGLTDGRTHQMTTSAHSIWWCLPKSGRNRNVTENVTVTFGQNQNMPNMREKKLLFRHWNRNWNRNL